MLQHARNSKVTDLDLPVLSHENVLGLEVSVQNFAVMDVLDRQCHLHEPVQDLVFRVANLELLNILSLTFSNLFLISNFRVKISAVGKVHNYAQTLLVHEAFFVGDDVGVSHCFENMDL